MNAIGENSRVDKTFHNTAAPLKPQFNLFIHHIKLFYRTLATSRLQISPYGKTNRLSFLAEKASLSVGVQPRSEVWFAQKDHRSTLSQVTGNRQFGNLQLSYGF